MSEIALFASQIALAALISLAVINYLRRILRAMLLEICDQQPQRAEFWVRLLDMMMLIAPVILVMMFWDGQDGVAFMLRRTLLLVLIGQFISLAVVGRTIWGFVQPPKLPPQVLAGGFTVTGPRN
jgi:hypothetical protein